MNSYPPELLVQLAPVMFAAGLDPPSASVPTTSPDNRGHISQGSMSAPQPPTKQSQDPFALLSLRLRDALLAPRKVAIWQPEKAKSFQVFLVDKGVRFPPRKLDLQDPAAHSPLSPLTQSSPLYPDGLIAPIWIRKHTMLVPSVFVLFLRIFELPAVASRTPLDMPDSGREREREQEERRRDSELSAEIASRKKSTSERGIKLTVVLMASRRMLDDPSLDDRLTFIRRQSGLDSRASLFVLSPVSPSELGEFVKSLQEALYEPAVEYYTNHSKRVRRKRNRHSQAVPSYHNPLPPLSSTNPARPLRPEGWTVRYEYKMACFAEFRGEDEVALKHYQDAYSALLTMFGSTAILPPRTKRWAEAKVLADCINVKVSKLYLYNNEHALALSHHNSHLRKFGDFSRGWGIGEETFEFWSWMARQHRVLADLLEQGVRSTLKIPSHLPVPAPPANSVALAASVPSPKAASALEAGALGLNPSHALQHPGFYYYMAARCTEMRRERFMLAAESESASHTPIAPGFANEKKVDHLGIILELYTKAYEIFKKYTPVEQQNDNQGRLILLVAYRIAQTYYDQKNFDMASRFFERIAKTYRQERWKSMLQPLLSSWHICAKELGDVELCIKLVIEMLGYNTRNEANEPQALENDLLSLLKGPVPPSISQPLVVDSSESEPIFDTMVVFWKPEINVGESVAFQLSLLSPSQLSIASLPFASLILEFSDDIPSIVIRHTESESPNSLVQIVDIGDVTAPREQREVAANLRWKMGATIIFSGTVTSGKPGVISVSKLLLSLQEGDWKIDIPLEPCSTRRGSALSAKWLCSVDPVLFIPVTRDDLSTAIVRHRPHEIHVSLSHQSPAYLDETFPIIIDITNEDDRDLDLVADVLLQPTEIDNAVNTIAMDNETSSGLIKGVPLGVLGPGDSVRKTLYLTSAGAPGDRMVDISIQSRATTDSALEDDPDVAALHDVSETLRTLVVPAISPIKASFAVGYRRALGQLSKLADLTTFDSDYWDDRNGEAVVRTTISTEGPWELELEMVKLLRQDSESAKVISSTIDTAGANIFPSECSPGDELSDICRISLAPGEGRDVGTNSILEIGTYEITWRRILPTGLRGHQSTTHVLLPPLKPPTNGLVALLNVPPVAKLHVPLSAYLTIRNHHPNKSANVTVQLDPDPSDGFVVAGLRNGRLPILLPGSEETLVWKLIPMECGHVRIPRLKVVDRRKTIVSSQGIGGPEAEVEAEGYAVDVVDVRWDVRRQDSDERASSVRSSVESARVIQKAVEGGVMSILVLP